jgi:hypothetical protein
MNAAWHQTVRVGCLSAIVCVFQKLHFRGVYKFKNRWIFFRSVAAAHPTEAVVAVRWTITGKPGRHIRSILAPVTGL